MSVTTDTKQRPILFSGPMVRAILEGRKTQTRRPLRHQPEEGTVKLDFCPDINFWTPWNKFDGLCDGGGHCPFGRPGDRLWVRETFTFENTYEYPGENLPDDGRPIKKFSDEWGGSEYELIPRYRSTEPDTLLICEDDKCKPCMDGDGSSHWKPSIHMPRWASRITLEITNVRVERIKDISRSDLRREGVPDHDGVRDGVERDEFSERWNKTYPGSWDRNDWVWVIEFKRVSGLKSE